MLSKHLCARASPTSHFKTQPGYRLLGPLRGGKTISCHPSWFRNKAGTPPYPQQPPWGPRRAPITLIQKAFPEQLSRERVWIWLGVSCVLQRSLRICPFFWVCEDTHAWRGGKSGGTSYNTNVFPSTVDGSVTLLKLGRAISSSMSDTRVWNVLCKLWITLFYENWE